METKSVVRIGVISDTHGLLRDEAAIALKGVDLIIHAGDIDTPNVLAELGRIAPIKAVRGNMDKGNWANGLSPFELFEIGGISIYVLHDVLQLDLDPKAAQIDVVVNGHTHRPLVQEKDGVLYINPGSAGYPKYGQSPTVALLQIKGQSLQTRIIELFE